MLDDTRALGIVCSRLFLLCCLLYGLPGVGSAEAKADTFIISTPQDAPRAGAIVSLVRKAYQQLGHDIEIRLLPAKRALLQAQYHEEFDGELARIAQAQAELPGLIRVPVPLIKVKLKTLSYELNKPIAAFNGLGQYRLVAIRGLVITDNRLKGFDTSYVNDMAQALALLDSRRVDLLVVPGLFTQSEDVQARALHIFDAPIEPARIYHYIKARHKDLVPALSDALSAVTGNAIEKSPLVR